VHTTKLVELMARFPRRRPSDRCQFGEENLPRDERQRARCAESSPPIPTLCWGSRDPFLGVLPFFGAAPSDEAVHHSDVLVDDPFLQLITGVVANVAGLR
jgi:hypothetical protein